MSFLVNNPVNGVNLLLSTGAGAAGAFQVKHYITYVIQHISNLLEKLVVFDRLVHIHYFPIVSARSSEKELFKEQKLCLTRDLLVCHFRNAGMWEKSDPVTCYPT